MRDKKVPRTNGIYDNDPRAHLPRYLLALLKKEDLDSIVSRPRYMEGAYAFLDISGFTPLSETLSKYGREGTEILTLQISSYFQKALETIFLWGGDVVKFGGDALTVVFEKEDDEDDISPLLRACCSSLSITRSLSDFSAETPFGTFQLSLKIGISSGKVLFMTIGDRSTRLEYIFAGAPIDRTAESEHNARPSQIVVDPFCSGLLKEHADMDTHENGFSVLKQMRSRPSPLVSKTDEKIDVQLIRPFLLPTVFEHIKLGSENMMSDHRPVVPCFVSFPSLDFEDMGQASNLRGYFQKVSELLKGLGGSFNRMDMGDKGSKFLSFFGAPESYADNEERAVAFALELKEFEKSEKWLSGQSIGVTSGVCYAGIVGSGLRREYTIMGDTVNISARLMGAAKGKILVTKTVRERTKSKFRYSPYVSLTLKGKAMEVPVSSPTGIVTKRTADEASGRKYFAGRRLESKALGKLIDHSARPVYISGPPGIGKSALAKKVSEGFTPGAWERTLLSAPISRPFPFYLIREILRSFLSKQGIPNAGLRAIENFFPDKTDLVPLFSILTNENVEIPRALQSFSREQKLETLSELFAELLQRGKGKHLFILDDFDRASKEESDFLSGVLEREDFKKNKYVLIGRSDRCSVPKAKAFPLNGLTREDTEAFVLDFLKAGAVSTDLVSFLYERSTGNPLYLSEILSELKDMNIVTLNKDGFVIWKAEMGSSISRSIEEIILMRLDNLDYVQKNMIKVASCFGETFDNDTLSRIFIPKLDSEAIDRTLSGLSYLGVEKAPESSYVFSNKLLRNVAYDSILVSNRRSIHLQIGEIFETKKGEMVSPETLAFHFSNGGNYGKAYDYSLKAARNAFSLSAFHEAQRLYGNACSFSEKTGNELEEEDRLDYSKSLISTGEYEKAKELLRQLETSVDPEVSLNAKFLLVTILDQNGEYKKEHEESEELFNLANTGRNSQIAISSTKSAAASLVRLGKHDQALVWLEKGYKTASDFNLQEELPHLHILSGSVSYAKGDFSKAEDFYLRALEIGSRTSNYELLIRSYFGLSNCCLALGNAGKALEMAQKAHEISKKIGSRINILGAASNIAWANVSLGRPEAALKVLSDSASLVDEKIAPYPVATFFNQLGLTYYSLGNLKLAVKNFRKTLSIARRIGNVQFMVNATYNIADSLREMGDKKRAINGFLKLIRNYHRFVDSSFLKNVASDLLNLVEEDLERKKAFRLLRKVAVSLQSPLLFDDLIKSPHQ